MGLAFRAESMASVLFEQMLAEAGLEYITKRTLQKTRLFAMIAAGLMLVALVSAVFGWTNWNRARAADQQAQKARPTPRSWSASDRGL
jgi:hypothetical protein